MNTQHQQDRSGIVSEKQVENSDKKCRPACPVCGGSLIEIRAKLQCSKCHTICETCCEGGRG
ncbi:MAG: hypothetical protein SGI77_11425 [Pirellulaceae bacterium]|nr:hypothetical protein [Pirellulaceae bacterium]